MDVRAAKWREASEERFDSATDLFQKREGNYFVTFFLSYPPESRVHATLTEYENVSQNTIQSRHSQVHNLHYKFQ
jgi:hypothetical protein